MRTAGLLIFLAITSPALTAAAQGAEATVYFVAPDAAAARKANLLPYEATLRTAAVVLASRGAAVRYVPREQLGSLGPEDYPRIEFDFSAEEWPVVKRERVDRSKVLTVARFKTGSWAELLTSVADEAADILEGLFEEGRIKAVALKPGDAEKLDEALALVCERGPDGARAAAAKIEEVLANGPSAAALRAACLPGACLAGIDLYGHFQYRNRVLALPVSFAAAARLVVGADEAEGRPSPEKLAEAWVALLCGFPAESLEMVKAAGELEGAAASLARALEVWALRDWRRYEYSPVEEPAEAKTAGDPASGSATRLSIDDASAVEQMAWLWAVENSLVFKIHFDTARGILRARTSAAFAPLQKVHGVGSGRRLTPIIMAMAFRDAVWTVLSDEDVPLEQRQSLLEKYTGKSVAGEDAVLAKAREVCTRIAKETHQELDGKVVEFMWEASDLGLGAPSGPVVEGRWRVLEPWYVAQVYRGAALQSAQLRVYLLQKTWCVPEYALRFLGAFTEGSNDDRDHAQFLRAMYLQFSGKKKESSREYGEIFTSDIGVQPYQWWLLSRWWPDSWLEKSAGDRRCVVHPIGAFQNRMRLDSICWGNDPSDQTRRAYELTVRQDPRSDIRKAADVYESSEAAVLEGLSREMADSRNLLYGMMVRAKRREDWGVVVTVGKILTERHPGYSSGYTALAEAYKQSQDRARAIEMLEKALANMERSVGRSNTQADLVDLLVEEGRIDEALTHGAHAAPSYSSKALGAYARALIAADRIDEGLEYYRKRAFRYKSCVWSYLKAALRHGRETAEVLADAEELVSEHGITDRRDYVIGPFLVYEKFDAARQLIEGACKSDHPGENERFMGALNLIRGDFKEAADWFRKGTLLGFVHPKNGTDARYSVAQAHIAMILADDRQGCERARSLMADCKLGEKSGFRAVYDYVTGKLDKERAIEVAKDGYVDNRIYLYWIFGAEEEVAGNIDKAVEWYAGGYEPEDGRERYGATFMKRRLAHFEGRRQETKPPGAEE